MPKKGNLSRKKGTAPESPPLPTLEDDPVNYVYPDYVPWSAPTPPKPEPAPILVVKKCGKH